MSDSIYGVKVEIYNTVLHDLLKIYVEDGIFRDRNDDYTMIHLADGISKGENPSQACAVFINKTPVAFHNRYSPEGYKDILPCLLLFFRYELSLTKEEYKKVKEGILAHRREIDHAYDHVLWETTYKSMGGDYNPRDGLITKKTKFQYDRFSDLSELVEITRRTGFLDEDFYGFEKESKYEDILEKEE